MKWLRNTNSANTEEIVKFYRNTNTSNRKTLRTKLNFQVKIIRKLNSTAIIVTSSMIIDQVIIIDMNNLRILRSICLYDRI